jgi:hypothetical protein
VRSHDDMRIISILPLCASLPGQGLLTRVDFPSLDDADAFHRLVCGIRGIAPGP